MGLRGTRGQLRNHLGPPLPRPPECRHPTQRHGRAGGLPVEPADREVKAEQPSSAPGTARDRTQVPFHVGPAQSYPHRLAQAQSMIHPVHCSISGMPVRTWKRKIVGLTYFTVPQLRYPKPAAVPVLQPVRLPARSAPNGPGGTPVSCACRTGPSRRWSRPSSGDRPEKPMDHAMRDRLSRFPRRGSHDVSRFRELFYGLRRRRRTGWWINRKDPDRCTMEQRRGRTHQNGPGSRLVSQADRRVGFPRHGDTSDPC